MTPRDLYRLLAIGLVAVACVGCTAVQVAWYRCGHPGFSGWDYERECLRLTGAVR